MSRLDDRLTHELERAARAGRPRQASSNGSTAVALDAHPPRRDPGGSTGVVVVLAGTSVASSPERSVPDR